LAELREVLRIVVPDVPEVSGRVVAQQGAPSRLLLEKWLIVVNWAKYWHKGHRYRITALEIGGRPHGAIRAWQKDA